MLFFFSRETSNSEHLQTDPGHVVQGLDFMLMASERQSRFLYSLLPVLNVDLFPTSPEWFCIHWLMPSVMTTLARESRNSCTFLLPSALSPSSLLLIIVLIFSSIILITAKLKYYFVSWIQLLCLHLSIHPFILPFNFFLLMGIYFPHCPYESKDHLTPSCLYLVPLSPAHLSSSLVCTISLASEHIQ